MVLDWIMLVLSVRFPSGEKKKKTHNAGYEVRKRVNIAYNIIRSENITATPGKGS